MAYAYYNEIDPYAAQWLRNLIAAGHIADGYVDERSISDVRPADLVGFTQCHFFAGIGVWSHALRRAGWSDDRPIWTGSCPCQPFSSAGAGAGFADERHLWPHWEWLIRECGPPVVAGEQVASKDADPWIDLVQADLEALDYAFGCLPFPAASVGAPHIRDRNYWVADLPSVGHALRNGCSSDTGRRSGSRPKAVRCGDTVWLDHHHHQGPQGYAGDGNGGRGRAGSLGPVAAAGVPHGLADDDGEGLGSRPEIRLHGAERDLEYGRTEGSVRTSATNGIWGDADWLFCRDGKWRPVEPDTFPLAHGAASRVGRLRAYGNAIVAEAARHFISSYLDAAADRSAVLIGHNGGPALEDLLG